MTTHSISIENICMSYDGSFGGTNDADRAKYVWKYITVYNTANLPTGLSFMDPSNTVYQSTATVAFIYLTGSLSAASEGIYYAILRYSTKSTYID
jgi:hypothetical protein